MKRWLVFMMAVVLVVFILNGSVFGGKKGESVNSGNALNGNGSSEPPEWCPNMLQGRIRNTGYPLDIAIGGEGYVVFNDGESDLYSRGRSLFIDADLTLTDPNSGYIIQRKGTVGEDDGFQVPGDSNIYMPYDVPCPPKATTKIVVGGNLSADQSQEPTNRNILKSNVAYTTNNGTTAAPFTKIIDLDQFASGTLSSATITVSGYDPTGGALTDTGLAVTSTTTLGDLIAHLNNNVLNNSEQVATLSNGKIVITDIVAGYSQSDLKLSWDNAGTADWEEPAYFVISTVGGEEVKSVNITIYDALGRRHILSGAFVRTDTPDMWDMILTSIWDVVPSSSGQIIVQNEEGILLLEPIPLKPPLEPPSLLPTPIPIPILTPIPFEPQPILPELDSVHEITFDSRRINGIEFSNYDGSYQRLNPVIGDSATFGITFANIPAEQTITIEMGTPGQFNGLTQFAGTSTAVARAQDGYDAGNLASVSVDQEGVIIGAFSNGIKKDIATIKMAMFENVCGLEYIGYGYFLSTADSGEAVETQALANGAGSIHDRALEKLDEFGLTEPLPLAYINIAKAISRKEEALLILINNTLAKEWIAHELFEQMLEEGEYYGLEKNDIVNARQKVHSAIQHQKQARESLEKSIEMLAEAVESLGG